MCRECRERFLRRRRQMKPLFSDPSMHHGTCVMHLPLCMSGSPTRGDRQKSSRYSQRMRKSQFLVSGKKLMIFNKHSLISLPVTTNRNPAPPSIHLLDNNCWCLFQWNQRGKIHIGDLIAAKGVYSSWWRHQMEIFFAIQAICAGNSPVIGEFPSQKPVTRGFDVFFHLRLNKRLSKHS